MILGVDHVALSATDIDRAVENISFLGYRNKFIKKRLMNSTVKRPFLGHFSETHDIAYCQPIFPGTAIELTAHGSEYDGHCDRCYEAVFSGKIPDNIVPYGSPSSQQLMARDIVSGLFDTDAEMFFSREFRTAFYYLKAGDEKEDRSAGIRCMVREVRDPDASMPFWEGLGFSLKSEDTSGGQWKFLELERPVQSFSMKLLIVRSTGDEQYGSRLDMPGFTCIALLTGDISSEISGLKDCAPSVSDVFSLEVNGRTLKVCLLTGPDNEIVELIEIGR